MYLTIQSCSIKADFGKLRASYRQVKFKTTQIESEIKSKKFEFLRISQILVQNLD